jgi:hypothetical protein
MATDIIPREMLDSVPTGEFSSHKNCVSGMLAVLSRVDGDIMMVI